MTVLFSYFATILLDLWAFLGYTIDIDDETLTACLREDSGFSAAWFVVCKTHFEAE